MNDREDMPYKNNEKEFVPPPVKHTFYISKFTLIALIISLVLALMITIVQAIITKQSNDSKVAFAEAVANAQNKRNYYSYYIGE